MRPPAHAPVHLTVSSGWQWGFGIFHFAVAILVIYLFTRGPARERNWAEVRFRMLVLIGGGLGAVFFEGAVDRAGNLWYALPGQWKMIALFGIHVPLWVAPVYLWFTGGFALFTILQIRKGAGVATFAKIAGVLVLADIGFEIPIVRFAKLYVYYGHTQPLFNASWFPLPAWYITTNMFFVLLPALMVMAVMASGQRHIEWTIPFVMIAACYMCYGSVTWPVVAALQEGLSKTDTTLAALLTMALGCIATYVSCRVAPKLRHAMDWYGTSAITTDPVAASSATSQAVAPAGAWQP
ncbi:MAG: hypothetical protein QOI92_2670 [Chloroflexota bacterium]|nr:hypothetical protein [Chloroflexota bacterium]